MAEYHAKYSADQIKWFRNMEADGIAIPEAGKIPELFFDAVPFWTGFTELNSSRQSGMGMGYIPYSEITSWLNENEIEGLEQRQRYRYFITYTDYSYLDKARKVDKNKGNQS